ncbi:MAG: hypothetical protein WEB79_10195 [Thermoleophilaceae bacterium]
MDGRLRTFLGEYQDDELEAFIFLPSAGGLGIDEDHRVVAGPRSAVDDVIEVTQAGLPVSVLVTDRAWICVAKPSAHGGPVRVAMRGAHGTKETFI